MNKTVGTIAATLAITLGACGGSDTAQPAETVPAMSATPTTSEAPSPTTTEALAPATTVDELSECEAAQEMYRTTVAADGELDVEEFGGVRELQNACGWSDASTAEAMGLSAEKFGEFVYAWEVLIPIVEAASTTTEATAGTIDQQDDGECHAAAEKLIFAAEASASDESEEFLGVVEACRIAPADVSKLHAQGLVVFTVCKTRPIGQCILAGNTLYELATGNEYSPSDGG